jgi:hypothetical protein
MWECGARRLTFAWRKRKWPFDVRHLDARVDFFGPQLGFHYLYHPLDRSAHRDTDEQGFSVIWGQGQWHRQPTTHCHVTMDHFHRYLETGDPASKDRFLKGARLLLDARHRTRLGHVTCDVWHFGFEVSAYVPHPLPWISCLSQSWAISVFCRAYQMTGCEDYLESARGAMAAYEAPVAEGGIRWTDRRGRVYYEEYPFPGKVRHVLNGFMSSLMGLYDLYRATSDKPAKHLFEEGVATVASPDVLDRYDKGYISAYDQGPWSGVQPYNPRYHLLHVRQLLVLHRITGIEALRATADRWHRYSRDPTCRLRWRLECLAYRMRNLPHYLRDTIRSS